MTPRPLVIIDGDITAALRDLRYMRRCAEHSPSSETVADVTNAERYLDELFEERTRATEQAVTT